MKFEVPNIPKVNLAEKLKNLGLSKEFVFGFMALALSYTNMNAQSSTGLKPKGIPEQRHTEQDMQLIDITEPQIRVSKKPMLPGELVDITHYVPVDERSPTAMSAHMPEPGLVPPPEGYDDAEKKD